MPRLAWPRPVSGRLVSTRVLIPTILAPLALLLLAVALVSCGGSTVTGAPTPNIGGSWEFIAISSSGSVTGIEVALKEGQLQVGGLTKYDGQLTASSQQIAFVSLDTVSQFYNATGFGGTCQPTTTAISLGPGSVTALGAPINFTFTENGNLFNVTGMLSGDGQSMLNGTYTAQTGNTCSDTGGSITGLVVGKLSGTYTGKMCPLSSTSCNPPTDSTDTVISATLSESSSGGATLSLVLSGTDNTTFTMTGQVMGNAFLVQGTFQGQLLTYYGYSESFKNVASLYLVNATNPAQPFYVGTLGVPQI